MRTPRYSILSLMLSLIMFGGTQPTIAAGNGKVLEGSVKEEHKGNVLSGSTTRTGKVLEGSIKDEATLHPSLKVIPSVPGITQPGSRYTGEVTQYRGSKSNFPSMRPASQAHPSSVGTRQFGLIPPISSYTLSPGTGIMSAPGFEVSRPTASKGVTTFSPDNAFSNTASTPGVHSLLPGSENTNKSYKGVTSFVPGYEVSTESAFSSELLFRGSGKPIHASLSMTSGVTTYVPGFEILRNVPQTGLIASRPGSESYTPPSKHGITSWIPGYEVSVSTPRNGVSTYQPGYEVALSTARYTKNTLGGMWWTSPQTTPELAAQPGVLPDRTFVQPVLPEGETPLIATAGSLEHNPAVDGTNLTWNAWYRQVAKAIYSRWQYAEVGPGVATVQVTVTRDRNIYCQVVDFAPGLYVERDVASETSFREAAIRAVNNVQSYEIPRFPAGSSVQDVTFDVLMKRTVDGPAGFDISVAAKRDAP